jgi:hypothetical protein
MLCRSNLVRTVWDGDQVLHEVSAPASGAGMEQDVPPMLDSFLGPHHFGRVMYVHGGGIDQPVAVVRSEYSDSLHTGVVYPLANHKGQYDMGISTCVLVTPRSPMLTEHHGEQQIGTDTMNWHLSRR